MEGNTKRAEADAAKHTIGIISFPLTTPLPPRTVITTGLWAKETRWRNLWGFDFCSFFFFFYLLHYSNVFTMVFLSSVCVCTCMCKCVFVLVCVHIKTYRGSRWGTECPPLTPSLDALGQGLCVILELGWQLENSSIFQSFLLWPCPALGLQECTCPHLFSGLSTQDLTRSTLPTVSFPQPRVQYFWSLKINLKTKELKSGGNKSHQRC